MSSFKTVGGKNYVQSQAEADYWNNDHYKKFVGSAQEAAKKEWGSKEFIVGEPPKPPSQEKPKPTSAPAPAAPSPPPPPAPPAPPPAPAPTVPASLAGLNAAAGNSGPMQIDGMGSAEVGGMNGDQMGALRPLGRRMPPMESMALAGLGKRVY